MLIHNYALDHNNPDLVVVRDRYADLAGVISASAASLLVWRNALPAARLQRAMGDPSWPLSLWAALAPRDGWQWSLRSEEGEEREDHRSMFERLREATGAEQPPSGNVTASLVFRHCRDRTGTQGSADWLRERLRVQAQATGFAGDFISAVLQMQERVAETGNALYVEQLSIVLSKDVSRPCSALAPCLHSDIAYGRRESATVSLLEPGWDARGGSMFMPTRRMSDLLDLRPLTVPRILEVLPDEPLLTSQGGDLLIYDGQLNADGERDYARGIPHISSDMPGLTSRLVLLIYHRPAVSAVPARGWLAHPFPPVEPIKEALS